MEAEILEKKLTEAELKRQLNALIVAHLRGNNLTEAASAVASATLTPLDVEAPPDALLELFKKAASSVSSATVAPLDVDAPPNKRLKLFGKGISDGTSSDVGLLPLSDVGTSSILSSGYGSKPARLAASVDFSAPHNTKGFPKHEPRHLDEHKNAVRCARFSPDGKYVATGSADASIKLFEIFKDKQTMVFEARDGHVNPYKPVVRSFPGCIQPINDLDFHPNKTILISGRKDHTIKFYDFSEVSTKEAIKVIKDTHNVRSVSFHPTGNFVLAGTDHPSPRLYNVLTDTCTVFTLPDDCICGPINQARYSSTGTMYVTASKDGAVRLWDVATARCVRPILGAHGTAGAISAVFTKDERFVLSSGKDSTMKLWDVGSGKRVKEFCGAARTQLRRPATFNDNEEFVLSIDELKNEIVVWDTLTANEVARWPSTHVDAPRWLEHSPTEAAFVTCGNDDDRSIKFWRESL